MIIIIIIIIIIIVVVQAKEEAVLLCNAVTFDLIGLNKAARVGARADAELYLKEMRDDVAKFLALEPPQ